MKGCRAPACAHLSNAAIPAEINASLNTVSVAGHRVEDGSIDVLPRETPDGIVEQEMNEDLFRRANLYPVRDGLYDAQSGSGSL